jgi:hypothetical protein
MKKILTEIFFGKNSITSGVLALLVISAIGLGCFCNKNKLESLSNSGTSTPTPAPTKAFTKADASKSEVPTDEEMQEIVKRTMLDFNDAIKKEDFTDFHSQISKKFKEQTTPEKFKRGFIQFIEKKLDISAIKSEKADFTSGPKIVKNNKNTELTVEGRYDISPNPVRFKLNYIPEDKDWKLFGIEVNTRKD